MKKVQTCVTGSGETLKICLYLINVGITVPLVGFLPSIGLTYNKMGSLKKVSGFDS